MSSDELSVSEAREQLASLIDRVRAEHQPVFLSRRGRRVAAVIDAEDLERLIEMAEDAADVRAAAEAHREMAATGATPVPWDTVTADLGL